jgi:dinuclear metal center YbgI/SA1388 family protein
MSKIVELTRYLESMAPLYYQESYDNSGLLCGNPNWQISGVMIALDAVEEVVDEAIEKNCNLVISHHPIIFNGLKKLTGSNYIERTIVKAIKNDVAIYAIHTNLDNVLRNGVNQVIADRIGLHSTRILSPKQEALTLELSVSDLLFDNVLEGLEKFKKEKYFNFEYFKVAGAKPNKIKVHGDRHILLDLHPLIDQYDLEAHWQKKDNHAAEVGAGLIGELDLPMGEEAFLSMVKERLQAGVVRHTQLLGRSISRVAVCGGSGSFLLNKAIASGAHAFVSADFKYHQFFDADKRIVIADVGHFESEQFTVDLLYKLVTEKFSNFAAHCTNVRTNPVHYF